MNSCPFLISRLSISRSNAPSLSNTWNKSSPDWWEIILICSSSFIKIKNLFVRSCHIPLPSFHAWFKEHFCFKNMWWLCNILLSFLSGSLFSGVYSPWRSPVREKQNQPLSRLERFRIECGKTKTKEITLANHKRLTIEWTNTCARFWLLIGWPEFLANRVAKWC